MTQIYYSAISLNSYYTKYEITYIKKIAAEQNFFTLIALSVIPVWEIKDQESQVITTYRITNV